MFMVLAQAERALARNTSLSAILKEAFHNRFSSTSKEPLGEIQRDYLLAESSLLYQHYGLAMFSEAARSMIEPEMARRAGLPRTVISRWIAAVFDVIYEDLHILKVLSGEPEWTDLDRDFSLDVFARIACLSTSEEHALGLSPLNPDMVNALSRAFGHWLEIQNENRDSKLPAAIATAVSSLPHPKLFAEAAIATLNAVARDPLQILTWRVRFHVSFSDHRIESKIILRQRGEGIDRETLRLSALLATLLPHQAKSGQYLLPESPVSRSQVEEILCKGYVPAGFDTMLFRNWLGGWLSTEELTQLIELGKETGFILELPIRKKKFGVALSLAALRVLSPYHSTISSLLRMETRFLPPAQDEIEDKNSLTKKENSASEPSPLYGLPDEVFNAWIGRS